LQPWLLMNVYSILLAVVFDHFHDRRIQCCLYQLERHVLRPPCCATSQSTRQTDRPIDGFLVFLVSSWYTFHILLDPTGVEAVEPISRPSLMGGLGTAIYRVGRENRSGKRSQTSTRGTRLGTNHQSRVIAIQK
jgi:hypothetical protein